MLTQGLGPASDQLGIFSTMLRDLREFRIAAKRLAREAEAPADRLLLNALQQTFKIFINSFYGYLGTGFSHWNDFDAANRITAEGRRLVLSLVDRLDALGATVIEVDTDGLYFVPATPVAGPGDEDALLAALGEPLPDGIQLELAGRYPAMFSYKMKNYVLLDGHGKLLVKGSGLRSRGLELFQRRWMEEMFRLLLTGRREEIPALVRRWEEDFTARRVAVRLFMKTETLQESPGAYREKLAAGKRNVGAAYELALRAERPYQAGDQVSYYVTGETARVKVNEAAKLAAAWDPAAPDENTSYYLAKLRELAAKFLPFAEGDGLIVVSEDGGDAPDVPVQDSLDLGA
jgi:DNA polymerase I